MENNSRKNILIIEDDTTVVDFLKFALEKENFNVSFIFDGNKVIDFIEKEKIDLILLDMMLPGKGGYEIIKILQNSEYSKIPVITITGKFIDDGHKNILLNEPNVIEYMVKPVKIELLLHTINKVLGISPSTKRIKEKNEEEIDPWSIQI